MEEKLPVENKKRICVRLLGLLSLTRAGVGLANLEYRTDGHDESVVITFAGGHRKVVDVTADNGVALIRDVLKAL
jgi:hypothetical protein